MIRPWKHWGIKARLMTACVLPVSLMFVVMVCFLYRTYTLAAQETVQAHANLMASALSDSAQYGVIFGDWSYLDHSVHTLLEKTDGSLRKIVVLDKARRILLNRENSRPLANACPDMLQRWCFMLMTSPDTGLSHFEVPIPEVFASIPTEDPWLGSARVLSSTPRTATIGHLVVVISPFALMRKQCWRIAIGAGTAFALLLTSGLLGWSLARSVTYPLVRIITTVRQIQGGDYNTCLTVSTGGEIRDLQVSIVEMAAHLAQFNRQMEDKVRHRTYELQLAKDQLAQLNEERRKLIQRIQSAAEDERRKIAFALHDHWNALVIAIRLRASHALRLSEESITLPQTEQLQASLNAIVTTTEQLYGSGRDLVKQLYPEMIEVIGLVGALEAMIDGYNASHPTCRFLLNVAENVPFTRGDSAITLYRLVQEALSNSVKHAAATRVAVNYAYDAQSCQFQLFIEDNGRGFESEKVAAGIGLIGMRERVQSLDGILTITSHPGKGTSILAVFGGI